MRAYFVFIKTDLGKTYDVAFELAEIEGVSEVYSVSGPWDLLVKLYLDKDRDVGHFVNQSIHLVPHIRDTQTLVTFNAFT